MTGTPDRTQKWFEQEADGTIHYRTYEDVEPDMDFAKAIREKREGAFKKFPEKQTFHHAAHVPPSIITKILAEDGVDFFNRNDLPKFMKILKEKYPAFITVPHNVLKGK